MVVRPPTGGHYLKYRFVWLLLLDLFYELLPFFFTPNQVFVEHNMANATSSFSAIQPQGPLSKFFQMNVRWNQGYGEEWRAPLWPM